jgi:hypothetical protein
MAAGNVAGSILPPFHGVVPPVESGWNGEKKAMPEESHEPEAGSTQIKLRSGRSG